MNILVLDDEAEIADLVELFLKNEGYNVYKFYSSSEAIKCINSTPLDLALLDVMLPDTDGFTILRTIREEGYRFPVIMLTAKVEDNDKIIGLSLGADDYITKPFSVLELISRVRAILRRCSVDDRQDVIKLGQIVFDDSKHIVTSCGEECNLTFKEYELLKYLLKNKGMALTRENIILNVWGYDFEGESRTVDMHITTLRQKLGSCGNLIKTVRNVGYKAGE